MTAGHPNLNGYERRQKFDCFWCRQGLLVHLDIVEDRRMHDLRGISKNLRGRVGKAKFAECLAEEPLVGIDHGDLVTSGGLPTREEERSGQ